MSEPAAGSVKSADRVLDLLELLARRGTAISHTEIAEALSIPKSSLTQLLRNLAARQYLDYDAASRGYRLGPAVAQLAGQARLERDILSIVEPVLADITATTRESSAFNQLTGMQSEVKASVSSPQRLVSHMRKGDLAPLYATSGGKALLAFMPEPQREDYLATVRFEQVTPNTIGSLQELRRQILQVQDSEVAYVADEFTPGISGIAMPVRSAQGQLLGSINVAVPTVRFTDAARDRIRAVLQQALAGIRRSLDPGAEAQAASGPTRR